MDDWQRAHGLFAYELATGILVGLVIRGSLSKAAATSLVEEAARYLREGYPALQTMIDEIQAKATAQIEMLAIEAERLSR